MQLGFPSWARFYDMCKRWDISWNPNPMNRRYQPGWYLQGYRRSGPIGFEPDGNDEYLPIETPIDAVLQKFVPIVTSGSRPRAPEDRVFKSLQRRAKKAGLSPSPPWVLGEATALAAAHEAVALGLAYPAR
jgi:hypothetical protein